MFEQAMPFAAVVMKGHGVFETRGENLSTLIRKITRRYVPEAEVEAYINEWKDLKTIVWFVPVDVIGWRRGY